MEHRRQFRFYLLSGAVVALWAFAGSSLIPDPAERPVPDFAEECLHEGCSGHEVEELYESYDEECLNEGCSKEEIVELAGNSSSVNAMFADFTSRGYHVDPDHFSGTTPICTGTTTFCTAIILWCNDNCTYPDGSKSSTYACGICIGFWW